MDKALLIIDYTYDFVADDGALTCGKPAQEIEDNICRLTESFLKDQMVFVCSDVHKDRDVYHPESKLFPPHNVIGTKGAELYGRVKGIVDKQSEDVIFIPKTRYSVFAGTNLDSLLRERGIKQLVLTGVCTDICVLHSAVSAYNLGYDLVIAKDAVASFDKAGHEFALTHFEKTLGAKVVESNKLV